MGVGEKIGVNYPGEENDIIGKILEIEERDIPYWSAGRCIMKIGSLNIRGLGAGIKKKKIRSLIEAGKLDFIAIQETKMESMGESECELLWGGVDFGWYHCLACGNSWGNAQLMGC